MSKLLLTSRFFRQDGVKNSLKMLTYNCKLRFFDYFCLALTKNTYREKQFILQNEVVLICH